MAATSSSTSVNLTAGRPPPAGSSGRRATRRRPARARRDGRPARCPRPAADPAGPTRPGPARTTARWVQEGPAGRCRLEQPEDHDVQVGTPRRSRRRTDRRSPRRGARPPAAAHQGGCRPVMLRTSPGWTAPPLFSATKSRRSEAAYPKVASRANSVSLAGSTSAPTRAQVDVAGGEAAGLEVRRHHQHAVEARPVARRRTASSAYLGDNVTAQCRVAAADHVDRYAQAGGQVEEHPSDPGVQLHLRRPRTGWQVGVGQEEAGRTAEGRPAAISSGSKT